MIRSAIALAALLALAAPARADDSALCRTGIVAEEAIRLARTAGIALVLELDCDDGRWEVEGRDGEGRPIEVDIHAGTGRVLKVDRDR